MQKMNARSIVELVQIADLVRTTGRLDDPHNGSH
jgi:hypothetical protein